MPETLIMLVVSIALNVIVTVLTPKRSPQQQTQTPAAPRPADGSNSFKQNVPSLAVALGTVKKGPDYAFREELNGTAYHVMPMAAHRIQGIVKHYLHDEEVALTGTYVTSPSHFGSTNVTIASWVGLDAETANTYLVATFPTMWTADHRGDGIARVEMTVGTVPQEQYLNVYPQQMPEYSAVLNGALLYDPRNEAHNPANHNTWSFSRNLALMRVFHLTHPSGFKLAKADLYMPEWIAAADVCDEIVINRGMGDEPRYHGGLWYRHENDPVEIGRFMDQAAEMVVYERPDGLIGVHPGKMVAPDIRITVDQILMLRYDANRSAASTVLAVRGRWTDPGSVYNTVDAAIYGDPYSGDDDTQRTQTVDNHAVQRHNHCQRLQKLAFIRANAPRVTIAIPYDASSPTRNVTYRRFVRVHYPLRGLDEAVVEIIGRPKLSLRDLTITFDGIVVPATLYEFDAATEEGVPGGEVGSTTPGGIPVPTGFAVTMGAETLAGGQGAAFAKGSWDFLSSALTYELEYQLNDLSEAPRSAMSKPGETEVRTQHLKDGAVYRFRLRTWSNNAASDWTSYQTKTASADVTPPGQPHTFTSFVSGSNVQLDWINPNSPNLHRVDIYRGATSIFADASVIGTYYGNIGQPQTYTDYGLTGEFWWWLQASNASEKPSTEVGPETQTVP
jgi:hypothetical protein